MKKNNIEFEYVCKACGKINESKPVAGENPMNWQTASTTCLHCGEEHSVEPRIKGMRDGS